MSATDGKYRRDTSYGRRPQWGRLYGRYFPKHTDGASRHTRMIADDLADPKSPIRRMLIDAGYEVDHWVSSLDATVQALWETRERLWKADPKGEQARYDKLLAEALRRTKKAA
jgi:hypothetical protein